MDMGVVTGTVMDMITEVATEEMVMTVEALVDVVAAATEKEDAVIAVIGFGRR